MTKFKVNYFDFGLMYGREIKWMTQTILPKLGIENYHAFGFEPCSTSFEKCKQISNKNISIINAAVANKNGKANLYHGKLPSRHSLFSKKYNVSETDYEEVKTIAFSEWLKKNVDDFKTSFNILRYNIEGAEQYLFDDIIANNLHKNIHVFCGTIPSWDMSKIKGMEQKAIEFRKYLHKHRITIFPFSSLKCHIEPITNTIRNKLRLFT